jgi:hypothetical protein
LLKRLRSLRAANVLPHLKLLGIVGNMVSAQAGEPNSTEARILGEASAAASTNDVWGSPVPLHCIKLREYAYYATAAREGEQGTRLRLPINHKLVREEYEALADEIEERIHEDLGIARVPA